MRARFVALVLAAVAAGVAAAVALAAPSSERASATAIAVIVKVPGQADVSAGTVSAPPTATETVAGYAFGESVLVAGGVARAQTGPGAAPHAVASGELNGISLLGGAVTLDRVVVRAEALASGDPTGNFSGSRLEGLTVLGTQVAPSANGRIELGEIGYAVALEQAVQHEDGDGPGYRGFVAALHVYLTSARAGLPAGSEIILGYAEAAVRGEPPAPGSPAAPEEAEEEAEEEATPEQGGSPGASAASGEREPDAPPPGAHGGPPAIVRHPPADVQPDITGEGFVFPVYGQSGFSDDFAAPRADTIWHHGNDVFAPLGAPVLAATDGTLFLVGWNRLGGHRLWLRDDQGNEYYYAHLSAYSPLAAAGARVQTGDVLGFVGASGAAGGVPHLHFEIHPRALLGLGYDGVINPYTYLLAWRARQDRDFRVTVPVAEAARPGAVLLDGNDISTASGLDPAAVERTLLGSPLSPSLGQLLLSSSPPGLVGAPAGFARS